MSAVSQRWTVARLGTAQTLAWASSYYLPAMLAAPMARDLGVTTPTVFAAFGVVIDGDGSHGGCCGWLTGWKGLRIGRLLA